MTVPALLSDWMNIEPSIDHSTLSGRSMETSSLSIVKELEAEKNEPPVKLRAKSSMYTPEYSSARTTGRDNTWLWQVQETAAVKTRQTILTLGWTTWVGTDIFELSSIQPCRTIRSKGTAAAATSRQRTLQIEPTPESQTIASKQLPVATTVAA